MSNQMSKIVLLLPAALYEPTANYEFLMSGEANPGIMQAERQVGSEQSRGTRYNGKSRMQTQAFVTSGALVATASLG